jgi:pimeloyl-ACP methyl ester carboxylesterase
MWTPRVRAAEARIESLLSARLFLAPQAVGDRLFFVSNLGGQLGLYGMDRGGSVPEPLLPPDIALQNPHLVPGYLYYAFPRLGRIVVMIDRDGDENYQPNAVPIDGGLPEPLFQATFADQRVHMTEVDAERNVAYFVAESRKEAMNTAYQADLASGAIVRLGGSPWGSYVDAASEGHDAAILIDGYTVADNVLYRWVRGQGDRTLLYGKPIEARAEGETVPLNGISGCHFVGNRGLLLTTYLFDDAGGLGWLDLADPREVVPVRVQGTKHRGHGELDRLSHLRDDRYLVGYNIDGASWACEGTFDEAAKTMALDRVLVGRGKLKAGVIESIRYDKEGDRFAMSFSTATSPTQLYTIEGPRRRIVPHTRERVLGIPSAWMSPGEDASFKSHDGTRVSARMYRPAAELGHDGPRPLVYYVHGGPQSQERPDFAWFSMPLIQFLTIHGFAVFVPNVRGSTGYGLAYTKHVDRDWGGQDRLDHVHAMTKVLPKDEGVDVGRAAVVGRSYGGYMSLTLAARHPELWSAAVDMFGPYDLTTFMDRIPETWKPYFRIALGDPEKDRDFLEERSPRTYMDAIACPLLVIQGKNDPRVVERESRDVVQRLRAQGKEVEYLVFEDEGHDVLKHKNRVRCYNAITEFFVKRLGA